MLRFFPGLVIATHALTVWPVWRWYLARTTDGSDEPWGIAALIAALALAWPFRRNSKLDERDPLLVVAIVANLLGLWLQHEVVQSVVDHTLARTTIPASALGVFGGFVTAARVMAVLMTLLGCSLLVWIIRRLMSASVRQEFA